MSIRPLVTETLFIPTNGIRLHVEAAGPEDGPMVLLLHGFPENWAGWIHQIPALVRSGFRVIAPDQRGYNWSDKPEGVDAYRMDQLVQDALGILEYFNRESAYIVGHDWGAVVAWQLAIRHPEKVNKLVIINVPHPAAMVRGLLSPSTGQFLRSGYIYLFQIPGLAEGLLRGVNYSGLRAMMKGSSKETTFSDQQIERYVEAWSQPGAITAMLNWYRAVVRGALRDGKKRHVSSMENRVTVPTLVLWGELDMALSAQMAEWSMDWVDDGRLVRFPKATHWLQHDEPERVNSRILDFITER